MNLGKLLKSAVRYAKANPDKVLIAAALVGGPLGKAAAKAAPIVVAATAKD